MSEVQPDGFGDWQKTVDGRLDTIDGRLDTIDGRLDGIDGRLDTIDGRLDGIDGRLDGIDGRLDGIDGRLDGIDERLDGIDERFDGIDRQFEQVDARFVDIRTHMGVLHEEALGRIAAISEEPLATKAEMDRGFAELKALISHRIEPLELVVRQLVQRHNQGG